MRDIIAQLEQGARVVIVRLRSLGDCVLTTPAIHLLKQQRPDLQIAVSVEDRFAAVFAGNPDIAEVLDSSVASVRKFDPQLCLNLHGGTRSIGITVASGAEFRAGYAHHRYHQIYNIAIPTAQEILGVDRKVHTAEHLASAMFYLGVKQQDIPRARLFSKPAETKKPYAVIHPFASSPEKTWPAERFLQLALHLQDHWDLDPVFIGTTADNVQQFQAWRTVTPYLPDTMSLLAGASLFVGNDSGPAHIAAAFGLPVVVLFAASDPVVWAPWKTQAETVISPDMARVTASHVVEALERLRVSA